MDERSGFDIKTDTGLTLEQFRDLFHRLPSLPLQFKYDKNSKTSSDSLYIYLMKLRTGRTHDDIGNFFNINRNTVTERINKVRLAMETDFVYENVNFLRSRADLAKHTSLFSQRLFCNGDTSRPVLVLDGTYIYVQKSSNFEFQKLSFSAQKKRNFVRVMMTTTTDGTIVSALGPYPASSNDAKVLQSIVENSNAFEHSVAGDVLLLDRGFRDCEPLLKRRGFDVRSPSSIQRSENNKQLSTKEANETRFVTANRYGVETRNGHLKTFKIFQKEWNNITLPHLMTDVRVCAALVNMYFRTIESNKNMADEIATKMLNQLNIPNRLSAIVHKDAFQKQVKNFVEFDDFQALPQLTNVDLIRIALGSYQIRQAPSYCQVHMKANESRFVVYTCSV